MIVARFFALDVLVVPFFVVFLMPLGAGFVWGFGSHFGGATRKGEECIH